MGESPYRCKSDSPNQMIKTKKPIRIPLSEREAVRLLGKVKPTADMPRPGARKKRGAEKYQQGKEDGPK